jgi:hypothetical protein
VESAARLRPQADVVKAEIREHVHRETADEPGLCLGFAGRFMFLMAYAILTTYEAY